MRAKKIIVKDKRTTIYWSDDTSTTVKCYRDDVFDIEKGFLIAHYIKHSDMSREEALGVLQALTIGERNKIEPSLNSKGHDICEYKFYKDNVPYPRATYKTGCGLKYTKLQGYKPGASGVLSNELVTPDGLCMKCHREIVVKKGDEK